ncbi:hypothetical protein Bca4012_035383 [Brassica carinata]
MSLPDVLMEEFHWRRKQQETYRPLGQTSPLYRNSLPRVIWMSFDLVALSDSTLPQWSEWTPPGALSFDSGYFVSLLQHKGLFTSDAALLTDPSAANIARVFQNSGSFLAQFGRSMIKMSSIKVLTPGDRSGEIRRNCRFVN